MSFLQIIQRITWVSPPSITSEWKRKVAQDAIEGLSASKLAKSICSQFCKRLKSSHEAFAASLKQVGIFYQLYIFCLKVCWSACAPMHSID